MLNPRALRSILSALWCIGAVVSAQVPVTPAFEVASVKLVKEFPPPPFGCGFGPGGRFRGVGTAQWFIACAYGIPAARAHEEISGSPNWLDVDLFAIEARSAPESVSRSQADGLVMLRSLLAERFKLAVHREAKEIPIYALVMARRDGKFGPRLLATPSQCAAWIGGGRQGAPPTIPGDLPCGRQVVNALGFRSTAMPMSQLANLLSPRVERLVQDQTGLTGTFALDLQWRQGDGPLGADLADNLPTSVFTALQEQLGLKLESRKGRVDLLVIDHVQRPTPN
jgi:uncharacterized protein (TIGR03435 family)